MMECSPLKKPFRSVFSYRPFLGRAQEIREEWHKEQQKEPFFSAKRKDVILTHHHLLPTYYHLLPDTCYPLNPPAPLVGATKLR